MKDCCNQTACAAFAPRAKSVWCFGWKQERECTLRSIIVQSNPLGGYRWPQGVCAKKQDKQTEDYYLPAKAFLCDLHSLLYLAAPYGHRLEHPCFSLLTTSKPTMQRPEYEVMDNNLGVPYVRVWQLDENSTRYDKIVAGPSDDTLVQYWYTWGILSTVTGAFTFTVFLAILSQYRKVLRNNAYNTYLIYLMIPDITYQLFCATTCLSSATIGHYTSTAMCKFQQWYGVSTVGANIWLNAVIAYELRKILLHVKQGKRYQPPTSRQVSIQALLVYAYTGFLGTWCLYQPEQKEGSLWAFHTGIRSGLGCLPLEVDRRSTIYFFFVFFPIYALIPLLVVAYVSYDVWRYSLLPQTGNSRLLTIYFGRLIAGFFIFWFPAMVMWFFFAPFSRPWIQFAAGAVGHIQGGFSAAISLLKPDIAQALRDFLSDLSRSLYSCCCCCCIVACHPVDVDDHKAKEKKVDGRWGETKEGATGNTGGGYAIGSIEAGAALAYSTLDEVPNVVGMQQDDPSSPEIWLSRFKSMLSSITTNHCDDDGASYPDVWNVNADSPPKQPKRPESGFDKDNVDMHIAPASNTMQQTPVTSLSNPKESSTDHPTIPMSSEGNLDGDTEKRPMQLPTVSKSLIESIGGGDVRGRCENDKNSNDVSCCNDCGSSISSLTASTMARHSVPRQPQHQLVKSNKSGSHHNARDDSLHHAFPPTSPIRTLSEVDSEEADPAAVCGQMDRWSCHNSAGSPAVSQTRQNPAIVRQLSLVSIPPTKPVRFISEVDVLTSDFEEISADK